MKTVMFSIIGIFLHGISLTMVLGGIRLTISSVSKVRIERVTYNVGSFETLKLKLRIYIRHSQQLLKSKISLDRINLEISSVI